MQMICTATLPPPGTSSATFTKTPVKCVDPTLPLRGHPISSHYSLKHTKHHSRQGVYTKFAPRAAGLSVRALKRGSPDPHIPSRHLWLVGSARLSCPGFLPFIAVSLNCWKGRRLSKSSQLSPNCSSWRWLERRRRFNLHYGCHSLFFWSCRASASLHCKGQINVFILYLCCGFACA